MSNELSLAIIRAALRKAHEKLDEAFKQILTSGENLDVEESDETKLTSRQKLEKQLETAQEKLTKLIEKIAGGKSKTKDKDEGLAKQAELFQQEQDFLHIAGGGATE